MHVIAAKAVAFREASAPEFRDYAGRVIGNAQAMAASLMERGIKLVSGGTDNHLILIDLSDRELTGKDAEAALEAAGITTNKNTVPGEKRSPFVTSGIRLGTAALTTRGMDEDDMRRIGGWIADVIEGPGDGAVRDRVRSGIRELAAERPLYEEWRTGHFADPVG